MNKKTIGRNDPCPCGSGLKYKKCCFGDDIPFDEMNHIIPLSKNIEYGEPITDDNFFKNNDIHELSAARIIYSNLLDPKIEKFVSEEMNKTITRGKEEKILIETTNDAKGLIEIMKSNPDIINHEKLKERILNYKEETIPIIIEELKKTQETVFYELAVRIIYYSGFDCSNEIIDTIKNNQRSAYVVSIFCMLLGFYDNKSTRKLLWDYYHYFKENYKNETYSDGPLLGLIEMRARRKESFFNRFEIKT